MRGLWLWVLMIALGALAVSVGSPVEAGVWAALVVLFRPRRLT